MKQLLKKHSPLSLILTVLFICALPDCVVADTLCVKTRQKVVRGRINLKKAIKRVEGDCPKGFSTLADTDEFKGADGAAGAKGDKGNTGAKGDDGTPATTYHAVINSDGSIYSKSNVVSATRASTGRYNIVFDGDITGCTALANPAWNSNADVVVISGVDGDYTDVVTVNIAKGGVPTNMSFNITVIC